MGEEALERLRAHQQLNQRQDPSLRSAGMAERQESDAGVEPAGRGE